MKDRFCRLPALIAYVMIMLSIILSFGVVQAANDYLTHRADHSQIFALRSCVRSNLMSALVHQPGGPIPLKSSERLFPILDCKQTIIQNRIIILSDPEEKKYSSIVLRGRAPIVNNGKVIGSRTILLQGVQNFSDAGRP